MAPRTREQQDAYNQKRRRESAAVKAGKLIGTAPSPKGKPATKAKTPPKVAKKVTATVRSGPVIKTKHMKYGVHQEEAKPANTQAFEAAEVRRASEMRVNGMLAIQQTPAMNTTLARSYVRKTGAGVGKLRRGTYQCTVAFTKVQMDALVAKASFRCVSLAEMIRSCVCENLGMISGVPE